MKKFIRNIRKKIHGKKLPLEGFSPSDVGICYVDDLSNPDLVRLNTLLPWMAFTADKRGRRFGDVAWLGKRVEPQDVPDRRIVLMNSAFGLEGSEVLEVGCFEGIHTAGLCMMGASVKAIDSRIENVVKTIVRTAMYGFYPKVFRYDLDERGGDLDDLSADYAHHVGVLYHLQDPVSHIMEMGKYIRHGIMLDTHIATDSQADKSYTVDGEAYRYMYYREHGRKDVFSGMRQHAKWLLLDDLRKALRISGFGSVEISEIRDERNGQRVLLFARREDA